jgi:glutathione S-transferase
MVILIGQYDSPFVRRVAIAAKLHGISYEHRPWSTFGDADKIAPFNPLRRVPTVLLDDGESLIDSAAILDWLDENAGQGQRLIAARGVERRRALKICALATGLADKSVSLLYERVLRKETSQVWIDRCRAQIADVLDELEADRDARHSAWWFGDHIGHADIAVTCAIRFTREAHDGLFDPHRMPALEGHFQKCESLEAFRDTVQPLAPPQAS